MSRRRSRGRRHGRRNAVGGGIAGALGISMDTFWTAAWSVPGGIAARAVPEMVLPAQNSGITGYALNLLTAIVASMAARRFVSPAAGNGVLIGGIAATGARIVSDQFGKELVTYASLNGMGGDPAFNLGDYAPAAFPLPYNGAPALPAAVAANGMGAAWGSF